MERIVVSVRRRKKKKKKKTNAATRLSVRVFGFNFTREKSSDSLMDLGQRPGALMASAGSFDALQFRDRASCCASDGERPERRRRHRDDDEAGRIGDREARANDGTADAETMTYRGAAPTHEKRYDRRIVVAAGPTTLIRWSFIIVGTAIRTGPISLPPTSATRGNESRFAGNPIRVRLALKRWPSFPLGNIPPGVAASASPSQSRRRRADESIEKRDHSKQAAGRSPSITHRAGWTRRPVQSCYDKRPHVVDYTHLTTLINDAILYFAPIRQPFSESNAHRG